MTPMPPSMAESVLVSLEDPSMTTASAERRFYRYVHREQAIALLEGWG